MLPIVAAALLSALAGGAMNKYRGGSFGKGALMGGALGAGGAGLAGLLGGSAAAGAAGGAAADTMGAGLTASAAAGAEPALAAGAGAAGTAGASGATGAGAATAGSMSALLKQAAINTGMQTAAGMAMPQYGMTQVGNVPQMPQLDASTELQQLMQQSMAKKGRV